ncbi:MAG: MFS transporter [Alphaproteobacteria bacterium]|nr:MFS transporter [Alphaproteobacteria bacterium]
MTNDNQAMKRLWIILICGALILTLTTGLRQALGLFLKPMTMDLGVGREVFGFGIALQNLLWGLGSPFAGAIADRFGVVKVSALGGLIYALGLAAMAFSTGGTSLVLGTLIIGIGLAGAGFSTVLGAVGRAAPPEKRSMALGIATAGGSFGQFAVVPLGHVVLEGFGWQMALIILAGVAMAMLPLSLGLAEGPRHVATQTQSFKQALGEAFRHPSYWYLVAGFFVCGFHVAFVVTHLPAYLADRAMPEWLGAWSLALVGLFNIIGSWGCGALGGKYSKKNLLSYLYFGRALVFIIFIFMPLSPFSVLLFAGSLGLLWLGTVPLTSGLVAQMFGPAYMSMLYGVVFLSHQVGSFFGAWLGGKAFDLTGSYDLMWWLSVALGVFSGLVNLPIKEAPVARLAAKSAE